eukprot:scaffold221_cov351-Pavlova_lutheri.AAC.38
MPCRTNAFEEATTKIEWKSCFTNVLPVPIRHVGEFWTGGSVFSHHPYYLYCIIGPWRTPVPMGVPSFGQVRLFVTH